MERKRTLKKKRSVQTKKSAATDYISVDGQAYEKISNNSVEIAFDLACDVLDKIDKQVESGKYVSRGDAIRHIIREVIAEKNSK